MVDPRRPDLGEVDYARRLARAGVDLSDLPACRAALVQALGFEPDIHWLSVRTRAVDLRIQRSHGEALAMLQGESVAFARTAEISAERIARLQARAAAQPGPVPFQPER